jgi:hypothetical protein
VRGIYQLIGRILDYISLLENVKLDSEMLQGVIIVKPGCLWRNRIDPKHSGNEVQSNLQQSIISNATTYSCILFAVYPTYVFKVYRLQGYLFFTQSRIQNISTAS